MNKRSLTFVMIVSLLCLVSTVTPVAAQDILGTIQGFIRSGNGDGLPGVGVTVQNQDTGISRTTTTDVNGLYRVTALVAGNYSVTAVLEGMQTTRQENIRLLVAQILDVNIGLQVESQSEVITVTAETPLIEVSRSSSANYISETEIQELPILGRDFKDFSFLAPTVQNDPVRGFLTMSGQRGIYSGLNLDGTSGKSAFFGYARGGEAAENDGIVVAQDSVKEFQVITNGFAPEYGQNGGGYINVITKSGTNALKGSAFYFFRDDSMTEDLPLSPLDRSRGRSPDLTPSQFERKNWGASVGGPIARDRTHFFFSYDQTDRTSPFRDDLTSPGAYDALLQMAQIDGRWDGLLAGYTPNSDGVAAVDPVNGRTATGIFNNDIENLVLFGKVDHSFSENRNQFSFRINYTDFERSSSLLSSESAKLEDTNSMIASLTSVIGNNGVNDARLHIAEDNLERRSALEGTNPIQQAEIRIRFGGGDDFFGKASFLPIYTNEEKIQFQDSYSYLFGNHDLKFGVDYQQDDLSQLFAGFADGRYEFRSPDQLLNNTPNSVLFFYGDTSNPNYDETQSILALYAQDRYKRGNFTFNYGLRWSKTDNPGALEHVFAEGRDIPDDDDNLQPRGGFAWDMKGDGTSVLRGGAGLFHSRTPSLIFAGGVTQNGIFPNYGILFLFRPGPTTLGYTPLGNTVNNQAPDPATPASTSYVDPRFEDPETWRYNLGYEREVGDGWAAAADAVLAKTNNLQSNVDLNSEIGSVDQFGRAIYTGERPNPLFNQIFVRKSIGYSEYKALTLKVQKRWNGKFQFQSHYTVASDKDTDSNERKATDITVSNPDNVGFDWGYSTRDVRHRFVASGVVALPLGFKVSGILKWQSGTPWTALDPDAEDLLDHPSGDPPFARGVVNGQLVGRSTFRNEGWRTLDVRAMKGFEFNNGLGIELFLEAFNLFNDSAFAVNNGDDTDAFSQQKVGDSEFGIGRDSIIGQRQYQVGARFRF